MVIVLRWIPWLTGDVVVGRRYRWIQLKQQESAKVMEPFLSYIPSNQLNYQFSWNELPDEQLAPRSEVEDRHYYHRSSTDQNYCKKDNPDKHSWLWVTSRTRIQTHLKWILGWLLSSIHRQSEPQFDSKASRKWLWITMCLSSQCSQWPGKVDARSTWVPFDLPGCIVFSLHAASFEIVWSMNIGSGKWYIVQQEKGPLILDPQWGCKENYARQFWTYADLFSGY